MADIFSPKQIDVFSAKKSDEKIANRPEWFKPEKYATPIKEKETKHEFSVGRLALSVGLDLLSMAGGSFIFGGLGGAVVTAARGAKMLQNATKLANLIVKGSRVTGETLGLATSSLIQGENTEEAIKGAIAAQALGYGIVKGGKYAVKTVKTVTPEAVKQKIADKSIKVYNWLFHGGNAKPSDIKDVHKELLSVANISTYVRRNAEEELKKFVKNPDDIRKLITVIEQEIIKNPNLIPDLPADKALAVLKKIKTTPFNEYSTEPHFLFELAKIPEIELLAKSILEKYPTLSKYDDLYKYSTEAYYNLIADKIDPRFLEQLNRNVAEIQYKISNKIKSLETITTAIAKGEKITADAFKEELKDTRQLIKALEELKDKKLLDNTKEVKTIILELKKTLKQLERVRISEIKESQKISEILNKTILDFQKIAMEFPDKIRVTPIAEEIKQAISKIGIITETAEKKVVISHLKNAIKQIDTYFELYMPTKAVYKSANIVKARNQLKEALKDVSKAGKERANFLKKQLKDLIKAEKEKVKELLPLQKHLMALKREISKAVKTISKFNIVKKGLLKQQEKDLTLRNLDKIRNLLPKIMPKNIKANIDALHNMYYPRIGLPAKIGLKEADTITSPFEYQIERITSEALSSFTNHIENIAKYLKERRYSTLLSKYADDILFKTSEEGFKIVYKSHRDFADIVTNAYTIPIAIDKLKKLFTKWISEGKTIETELKGFVSEKTGLPRKYLVPYAANSEKDMIKELARLNGLTEENAQQLFKSLHSQKLIGHFPELGVYVHKDIYELIGHSIKPLFAGKIMIFDPSKNIFGRLSSANTILKRIQMLFGIIHYKALTTAAIGTGRYKELAKAWESVFRSDAWFKEHVLPMQKEIIELTKKYNIKSTFFVASFDDIREQIQRLLLQEKLNPILKLTQKIGFIKLSSEFDKRLWDRLFYTLKCMSARNILSELEKGKITKEVAESFLDKLGSAFGGNYEWLFMRHSAREAIRFLLFAPDWYLTMIRHLTGSVAGHELFSEFFRRIFLLHYALSNEISWQLTGKTTWERFKESKNWLDLFKVPFVAIDPVTGKYKRSYINLLGFEIEGLEFLGFVALHDFLYEYYTTNKSLKEAINDATGKWEKHLSHKKGPIINSLFEMYKAMERGEGLDIIGALPMPIVASSVSFIFNRNVTFTEAGEKVPVELIATLYQTGMKYQASMELSKYYRMEMRKKVTPEEAKVILDKAYKEIKAVTDKVKAVKVPIKLQSDNPKTWFDTMMISVIMEDLKNNYKSDIEKIVNGKLKRSELEKKILQDFNGTAISYSPKFRKYVNSALNNIINKGYREYRRRHAGEE